MSTVCAIHCDIDSQWLTSVSDSVPCYCRCVFSDFWFWWLILYVDLIAHFWCLCCQLCHQFSFINFPTLLPSLFLCVDSQSLTPVVPILPGAVCPMGFLQVWLRFSVFSFGAQLQSMFQEASHTMDSLCCLTCNSQGGHLEALTLYLDSLIPTLYLASMV